MPELPEVNESRLLLDAQLKNTKILKLNVSTESIIKYCDIAEFKKVFNDFQVIAVSQHGKYLFLETEHGLWMIMHFAMTGKVVFTSRQDPPPPFSRIRFFLNDDRVLHYCSMRKLGF